jgi:hypothetical protein
MGPAPAPGLRFCNDGLGLIAVLGGDLMVRCNDLGRRQNLLSIACIVRRDLGRFGPGETAARDRFDDLLTARAGGVEVLLGVALDLRRSASPWLDLVTKGTKFVGEMRLIS